MIFALIVAAGQGKRMGNQLPKQYMPLAGQPILAHSLKTFDKVKSVDQLVLVVSADQMELCRKKVVASNRIQKPVSMVIGGERRQDSVYNGLQSLKNKSGIVLIHDGARPLVSPDLIEACIRGTQQWGACVPGIALVDTLKRIDGSGVVMDTIPRQSLRCIQTPQGFDLQMILQAHESAISTNAQVTDDAALVERMGRTVRVIPGESANLKITTPQDLIWAENIIMAGARKDAHRISGIREQRSDH